MLYELTKGDPLLLRLGEKVPPNGVYPCGCPASGIHMRDVGRCDSHQDKQDKQDDGKVRWVVGLKTTAADAKHPSFPKLPVKRNPPMPAIFTVGQRVRLKGLSLASAYGRVVAIINKDAVEVLFDTGHGSDKAIAQYNVGLELV